MVDGNARQPASGCSERRVGGRAPRPACQLRTRSRRPRRNAGSSVRVEEPPRIVFGCFSWRSAHSVPAGQKSQESAHACSQPVPGPCTCSLPVHLHLVGACWGATCFMGQAATVAAALRGGLRQQAPPRRRQRVRRLSPPFPNQTRPAHSPRAGQQQRHEAGGGGPGSRRATRSGLARGGEADSAAALPANSTLAAHLLGRCSTHVVTTSSRGCYQPAARRAGPASERLLAPLRHAGLRQQPGNTGSAQASPALSSCRVQADTEQRASLDRPPKLRGPAALAAWLLAAQRGCIAGGAMPCALRCCLRRRPPAQCTFALARSQHC